MATHRKSDGRLMVNGTDDAIKDRRHDLTQYKIYECHTFNMSILLNMSSHWSLDFILETFLSTQNLDLILTLIFRPFSVKFPFNMS